MKNARLISKSAIRTPLSGTTILVNYSRTSKILEVEFTGGRIYHYLNIEPSKWQEYKSIIESGGSSGTFVNREIKPNYKALEIK